MDCGLFCFFFPLAFFQRLEGAVVNGMVERGTFFRRRQGVGIFTGLFPGDSRVSANLTQSFFFIYDY